MLTKIVLIGPPGAGKSSVGRALSKELSMPFIDSDSEVEKIAGKRFLKYLLMMVNKYFVKWKLMLLVNYLRTFPALLH